MNKNKEGFYNKGEIPRQEIERLREFNYPNLVSAEVLENIDLANKHLADIGAGASGFLAKYVKSHGGKYIALDLRPEMLKSIKDELLNESIDFYGIQANSAELPLQDNSVDFVYQRFVLMHLSPEDRIKSVNEAIRASKNKIFLLEYNWGTFHSKENHEFVEKFKELSFKLMSQFGIDPFAGNELENLIKQVNLNLNLEIKHFSREEGDYQAEIKQLCEVSSKMARKVGNEELARDFDKTGEELKNISIKFAPPEIVVAVINKNYEPTNL